MTIFNFYVRLLRFLGYELTDRRSPRSGNFYSDITTTWISNAKQANAYFSVCAHQVRTDHDCGWVMAALDLWDAPYSTMKFCHREPVFSEVPLGILSESNSIGTASGSRRGPRRKTSDGPNPTRKRNQGNRWMSSLEIRVTTGKFEHDKTSICHPSRCDYWRIMQEVSRE